MDFIDIGLNVIFIGYVWKHLQSKSKSKRRRYWVHPLISDRLVTGKQWKSGMKLRNVLKHELISHTA
jgi:hypothetical protein